MNKINLIKYNLYYIYCNLSFISHNLFIYENVFIKIKLKN